MIATLLELIAPMPVEELKAILRAGQLRHFPALGGTRYAELIDWDRLLDLVASGTYPALSLRLTRHGKNLPPMMYRDRNQPRAGAIRQIMAQQGSIIAQGLDAYDPILGTLCTAFGAALGEKVIAAAVATIGEGGAVPVHYDHSDVIVVQIEGSKRWRIHRDAFPNPVPGMSEATTDPSEFGPAREITLQPGDFLVVPAGHFHICETIGHRSLHIAFSIFPMTAPRILDLLFREMADTPEDRAPVRFAAEDPAGQEALRQRLLDRIRDTPFDELIARHLDTYHAPGRSEY